MGRLTTVVICSLVSLAGALIVINSRGQNLAFVGLACIIGALIICILVSNQELKRNGLPLSKAQMVIRQLPTVSIWRMSAILVMLSGILFGRWIFNSFVLQGFLVWLSSVCLICHWQLYVVPSALAEHSKDH